MNWFDKGKERVLSKIAKEARIDLYTVEVIYGLLADHDLIDYDIEKDVFYREAEK